MIYKLSGRLEAVYTDALVIDVQGVGYYVHVSGKTLHHLPEIHAPLTVLTEHIIRQDAQLLCGFLEEAERQCFRSLLTVQGVGVKVALAILSVVTPEELAHAIYHQDRTLLTRADGVGPKVAGRIVLELKGKDFQFENTESPMSNSSLTDALEALISLGYGRSEAAQVLHKVVQENPEITASGDLIRLSLQRLTTRTLQR